MDQHLSECAAPGLHARKRAATQESINYFGSKDGVFLGATPPMPTEDEITAFVTGTGSSVLADLVETFTAALVDHSPDRELLRARRTLIQSTPELATREMARISDVEEHLVQMVLARFHARGRDEATTPDLLDEARIVVSLAAGVMKYTMRKWFSSDFVESPRAILQDSINLIRRVTN